MPARADEPKQRKPRAPFCGVGAFVFLGEQVLENVAGAGWRARQGLRSYPSTIVLNPPYIMRFMSKGIFFGAIAIAGSLITFLLTASRCAFDL